MNAGGHQRTFAMSGEPSWVDHLLREVEEDRQWIFVMSAVPSWADHRLWEDAHRVAKDSDPFPMVALSTWVDHLVERFGVSSVEPW